MLTQLHVQVKCQNQGSTTDDCLCSSEYSLTFHSTYNTLVHFGNKSTPSSYNICYNLLHKSTAAPLVAVPSLLASTGPNSLRNPAVGPEQFRWTLKTHLFACC